MTNIEVSVAHYYKFCLFRIFSSRRIRRQPRIIRVLRCGLPARHLKTSVGRIGAFLKFAIFWKYARPRLSESIFLCTQLPPCLHKKTHRCYFSLQRLSHDQARGIHSFVARCHLDLPAFCLPGGGCAPRRFLMAPQADDSGSSCRADSHRRVLFLLILLLAAGLVFFVAFFDAASPF